VTIIVEAAGNTHVGLVKQRNEDRFHIGQCLFAVADGLGGHPAGDVASDTVIESLQPYDEHVDPTELIDTLGRAVDAANTAVRRRIGSDPALRGMGSTLVALLRSGSTAALANVGDSRGYRLRAGKLERLTDDHNFGRLVFGVIDVPSLSERLTRFIDGRTDGRSPDLITVELQAGDRFLLCTDGLSSFVPPEQIDATLLSCGSPDETADRLVAQALEYGGGDNITVIVIDVQRP
jgi:protein phosphatase